MEQYARGYLELKDLPNTIEWIGDQDIDGGGDGMGLVYVAGKMYMKWLRPNVFFELVFVCLY